MMTLSLARRIVTGLASAVAALGVLAQAPSPTPAPRPKADPAMDQYYVLGPDSKPQPNVPKGKFVGPTYLPSQVFPGYQHTYFVYVPAQYDPGRPTPIMIFNDGQAMMAEPGDVQAQNVLDNLIYRREIPVMIAVFINPGRRPDQPEPVPTEWGDTRRCGPTNTTPRTTSTRG